MRFVNIYLMQPPPPRNPLHHGITVYTATRQPYTLLKTVAQAAVLEFCRGQSRVVQKPL